MKLGEFTSEAELAEFGAPPNPAQQVKPPQGVPDPREVAARQAEVAAQRKEIQDAIKAKQMEIIELQKQMAQIK